MGLFWFALFGRLSFKTLSRDGPGGRNVWLLPFGERVGVVGLDLDGAMRESSSLFLVQTIP